MHVMQASMHALCAMAHMDSAQPPLKYHGSHPALEARREGWRGGEGEEHNRTAWASYGGQRVEEVVRAELTISKTRK